MRGLGDGPGAPGWRAGSGRALAYGNARGVAVGLVAGLVLVALETWLMSMIGELYDRPGPPALVFVSAVLVAALPGRLVAALIVAAAGALSTLFYFTTPLHELALDDDFSILVIGAYACVASLAGALMAYAVESTQRAERMAHSLLEIQELTVALAGALTVAEVARVVVDRGALAFGARMAVLRLVDEEAGILRTVAEHGVPASLRALRQEYAVDGPTPSAEAFRERRLVVVPPGEPDRRYADPAIDDGTTALAVPLVVEGRTIGTVGIRVPGRVAVTAEDRAVLASFGEQSALALERARLREAELAARVEAERLSETLERMHELTPAVVASGGVAATEEAICASARESLDADAAALWHARPDAIELRRRVPAVPALPVGTRIGFERFPHFGEHLRAREPVFIEDVETVYPGLWTSFARESGSRSQLRLPLGHGASAEALLVISWRERAERPSARMLAAAARFADHAALALAEARQREAEEEARALHARLARGLLPRLETVDPRLHVATHYRPGDARLMLGGDFYDCVRTPDGQVELLVGDVAGHGPDAAALGAGLRAAFRTLALDGASPMRALDALEGLLVAERGSEEAFVTVCAASIDMDAATLEVVTAGHPPPVVVEPGRGARVVDAPITPPLGVRGSGPRRGSGPVGFRPGCAVVLYTDGLVDGRDPASPDGRWGVHALVAALSRLPPPIDAECLDRLVGAASDAHGGGLPDDVALLAATHLGEV